MDGWKMVSGKFNLETAKTKLDGVNPETTKRNLEGEKCNPEVSERNLDMEKMHKLIHPHHKH